ncbi:AMP-binding protein [Acuticoccus sp. MNP-M23]|uniref:AMP-binding protein n=1 Tax=Acuticoccus sp. MNP-M23 TaxID=3072793 RepID=UPI0028151317|nr:AMP-binding protein [Acuticoccus sp. MNP-M23]WMS41449.1 AMP-binding protein [Acuticoccus sp. MNP-M23]
MAGEYAAMMDAWRRDPAQFWLDAAGAIDWTEPPTRAFDEDAGVYGRWFPDAVGNTAWNTVDRHLPVRAEQVAIIHDSPLTGTVTTWTYADLHRQVNAFAAVLADCGVRKGDRVIVYMPMIPQTVAAMLACARIGAIHSVVFGGFAAKELAARLKDAAPTVILAASCGLEPGRIVAYEPLISEARRIAGLDIPALYLQRAEGPASIPPGDHDLGPLIEAALAKGRDVPCVPLKGTDPLYILYTSGTTGQPKGVVRDNAGHMVALAWSMANIYGVQPGEVYWAASDVGWVVGHSYIVYAPLLVGATTVLYEGKPVGTPDAGAFWRVCADHKVVTLFTAPTAIRAIKKEDPEGNCPKAHDLSAFRALFLAGERADPATIAWAERALGVPVLDHWWQTETGWTIVGNPFGLEPLPVKHGSPTCPMPGFEITILTDDGAPVAPGTLGNVAIRMPLPPSCLPTLWGADARFRSAYLTRFPGYYDTSDAGLVDEDGYVFIMARTDDVINVAGHRLSTGVMEDVLTSHRAVVECAVVGVEDPIKGQVPVGFVVLGNGVEFAGLEAELVAKVRQEVGPVAAFKHVIPVPRLPKTRSGKTLRATIKKIADGEDFAMPATIDDPKALDDIALALRQETDRLAGVKA